jgi:hypothetical protein
LAAHRVEPGPKVEAAREGIERDVDASHGDRKGSEEARLAGCIL